MLAKKTSKNQLTLPKEIANKNGDGSNYCPCHHSSAFLPAL